MPYIGNALITPGANIKSYKYKQGTDTSTGATSFPAVNKGADELRVYLNGSLLKFNADYTFTTSAVTISPAPADDDEIQVDVYTSMNIADTVSASDGGTFIEPVVFQNGVKTGAVKAQDGTSAISVADSTGVVAVASTLDVSAGTLTTSTAQKEAIVDGGTSNLIKDEDNMASNSDAHVPSQQSVKAYVDAQILTEDTISELNDTTITGTPADNEVLAYDTGSSKWINQTASEAGLIPSSDLIDEDNMATDSATRPPSQQSVKAYVDAQTTAQDLDFTTDTAGNSAVDLDSQVLTFTGGEGVDVTHSSQTVTVAGEDASTSNKGVASFSSDHFSVSSGAVSLSPIDEDDMASDSATKAPSQQSVKAFVNSEDVLMGYQGEPHIIPGVLYPAVGGNDINGTDIDESHGSTYTYGETHDGDGRQYYYTDIKGSKPIKDPRIGAHFGSQRHTCTSLQLLEQETATQSSSEASSTVTNVYSVDGREWMRAWGAWEVYNSSQGNGLKDTSTTAHNYLEVVGYFSDVSGLINQTVDSTDRGYIYKIDGGSFSAEQTQYEGGANTPLNGRYVDGTSLVSIVTGQTLGIHTLNIRTNAVSDYILVTGIELIAQDTTSTTTKSQIQIPSQNVVSYGKKFSVSGTPHYNPFAQDQAGTDVDIDDTTSHGSVATGWAGTGSGYFDDTLDTATSLGLSAWVQNSKYYRPVNGGRVVRWVDSSGNIKTSVNMMPPAGTSIGASSDTNTPEANDWTTDYQPLFHSTTIDHSQAEVAKTFHWREFGNGSANGNASYKDASTLNSAEDIAYVVDDGLTSLSADDVEGNLHVTSKSVLNLGSTDAAYLTFIGTGISLYSANWGETSVDWYNVAQNLPYGTHILKIYRDGSSNTSLTLDGVAVQPSESQGGYKNPSEITFYQPKRPPIPEDAVVIADYMLLADFVSITGDGLDGNGTIHKGVRRNCGSRDHFYDVTGSDFATGVYLSVTSAMGWGGLWGNQSPSTGANAITKLPFFGTVVSCTFQGAEHVDVALTIDGGSDLADSVTKLDNATTEPLDAWVTPVQTLGLHVLNHTRPPGAVTYGGTDIASPIHTSSHYQTFETPFLHELVGGDRNMEQTNLVVTPDGKTWDEVTRDVSYLGNSLLTASNDSNASDSETSANLFDQWRGKISTTPKRNYHNKHFAIAYDRVICLKDGQYQITSKGYAHTRTGDVGCIKVNGVRIAADYSPANYTYWHNSIVTNLQRGDYVQIEGKTHSSELPNLFQIEKV